MTTTCPVPLSRKLIPENKNILSIRTVTRKAYSQVTVPVSCDSKTSPRLLHCFQANFNRDVLTEEQREPS